MVDTTNVAIQSSNIVYSVELFIRVNREWETEKEGNSHPLLLVSIGNAISTALAASPMPCFEIFGMCVAGVCASMYRFQHFVCFFSS